MVKSLLVKTAVNDMVRMERTKQTSGAAGYKGTKMRLKQPTALTV